MKLPIYVRVARGRRGPKVSATANPIYEPLKTGSGWQAKYLPTAAFAIELDIPEEAFTQAERVLASLEIPADRIEVAAEVVEADQDA